MVRQQRFLESGQRLIFDIILADAQKYSALPQNLSFSFKHFREGDSHTIPLAHLTVTTRRHLSALSYIRLLSPHPPHAHVSLPFLTSIPQVTPHRTLTSAFCLPLSLPKSTRLSSVSYLPCLSLPLIFSN